MSRNSRKLETFERQLRQLKAELSPEGPRRLLLIEFQSGDAGRQEIRLLREVMERKCALIPGAEDTNFLPPRRLPESLVGGLDQIEASTLISLLWRWPIDGTSKPQLQQ